MANALREGFTTGTAAAAATAAAVDLLLGGAGADSIFVPLPPVPVKDGRPDWSGCARLRVPLSFCQGPEESDGASARAGVIKDGGDDPDATHKMLIIATVALTGEALTREGQAGEGRTGEGQAREEWTGPGETRSHDRPEPRPAAVPGLPNPVTLYGGQGIGTVTLPGLPVTPGEPAINPEPRKQIAAAACEAAARHGYSGPLHILLEAPEGRERAPRTLNPRLGILGGISILGTQGIVRPYSHDAWKVSILQGLDIAASLGFRRIHLSTGRRSERALMALYPGESPHSFIQVADFAAFSVRAAAERGFTNIVWGCFPGKLVKLAQGLGWTHAGNAPLNLGLLTEKALSHGAGTALMDKMAAMPTAAGALAELASASPDMHMAVMQDLARLARANLQNRVAEADIHSAPHAVDIRQLPQLRLHVFSMDGRLLCSVA